MSFEKEIARRRTFGIISHPDAGKTTLTEKLLLFGGAIQEAGAVKCSAGKTASAVSSHYLTYDICRRCIYFPSGGSTTVKITAC